MKLLLLLKASVLSFLFLLLFFVVIVAFIQIYGYCRDLVKNKSLDISNEDEQIVLYLKTNRSEIFFHMLFHWLTTALFCWLAYRVFIESSETIRQALNF